LEVHTFQNIIPEKYSLEENTDIKLQSLIQSGISKPEKDRFA
jgi:hypothetical protein